MKNFKDLREKTLTPAEKKKREEIAKAMERENPGMDMKKKMAIATWQAKKVAEETELDEGLYHVSYGVGLDHQVVAKDASDAHQKAMAHFKKTKPKLNDPKYSDTFNKKTITRIKGDEPRSDKYKTEEVEIDEGKKLTDTKADWRSDKSATAKNWSHNKLMKVAKHDRSAEKEIKRRIASKEYVFANEEVELDELNKSTLGSYIKRAAGERGHAGIEAGASASGSKDQKDAMSTMKKRLKGIKMASDRLAKESVEELDEISRDLARRYIRKVADKTNTGELTTKQVMKRRPGVNLAGKKAYPGIAGEPKVRATERAEFKTEAKDGDGANIVRDREFKEPKFKFKSHPYGSPEWHANKTAHEKFKAKQAAQAAKKAMKNEEVEDDMPASPDEKSMAMSQAKFIEYVAEEIKEYLEKDKPFPEWMQNKLSSLHENAKNMHAVLAGDYEDEDEMEEAVQSADKKPEKYVRPDGKVDFRMIRQDKKVIKNENV